MDSDNSNLKRMEELEERLEQALFERDIAREEVRILREKLEDEEKISVDFRDYFMDLHDKALRMFGEKLDELKLKASEGDAEDTDIQKEQPKTVTLPELTAAMSAAAKSTHHAAPKPISVGMFMVFSLDEILHGLPTVKGAHDHKRPLLDQDKVEMLKAAWRALDLGTDQDFLRACARTREVEKTKAIKQGNQKSFSDEEEDDKDENEKLNQLPGNVIISQRGVMPNIAPQLLKKVTSGGPSGSSQLSQSQPLKESQKANQPAKKRPAPPAKKSSPTKKPQAAKTRPAAVQEASEEESSDSESEEEDDQEVAANNAPAQDTQNNTQDNGDEEEAPAPPPARRAASKPPQPKPRSKVPAGKGKGLKPVAGTNNAPAAESQEA